MPFVLGKSISNKSKRVVYIGISAVAVIWVAVLIGPLIDLNWINGVRRFFWGDQLAYLSISENISRGNFAIVEPFTDTGVSYYPSFWYQLVGFFSLISTVPVWQVYVFLGVLTITSIACYIGLIGYRVSGLWIMIFVPTFLLLSGSYNYIFVGNWIEFFNNHSVIWPSLASLSVLNAESAGLLFLALAMALIFQDTRSKFGYRTLIASGIIGALSNVHTYVFFTGVFVLTLYFSIWCALKLGNLRGMFASAGIVTILFLFGSQIAESSSPIILFAMVIISFIPALWPLLRRNIRYTTFVAIIFTVTSGYQIFHTALGLFAKDEFLLYRQSSSSANQLEVPIFSYLRANILLILLCVIALIVIVQRSRDFAAIALIVTLPVSGLVLSQNSFWGFSQEPYRFGLATTILSASLFALPISIAYRDWKIPKVAKTKVSRIFVGSKSLGLLLLATLVILYFSSIPDTFAVMKAVRAESVENFQDSRNSAITDVLKDRAGLYAAGPCIEPRSLKLLGADQVVFFNRGLAWPENFERFEIFLDPSRRNNSDITALRAASVDFVISDSACPNQWIFKPNDRVSVIKRIDYESGKILLSKVLP